MKTTLQQLSIFLENKIGSLDETMDILSKADIRIIAATVADTTEFGILRLITSDNVKAYELLCNSHKNTNTSEVIALACNSLAGSFHDELQKFYTEGVVIEYMYCFSVKDKAVMIMRVNDTKKALEIAESKGITTLSNEDLNAL
ncbi:MAG: acetolactate synthase [Rikenellaceae bacterium]